MDLPAIETLNNTLRQFDGGEAIIWDSMRFCSAVVIAVSSFEPSNERLFLDCISCSRVSYRPSWQPAKIRLKPQELESSPIRISDGDSLQIDCRTARATTVVADESNRIYAGPSGTLTRMDLIAGLCDRYPESFGSIVAHFDGYSDALEKHLLPWDNRKPSLAAFREWIKLKLGWNTTTAGWERPITSSFPDDLDAAENFRRLYVEFCVEYDAGKIEDPPPRRGCAT